MRAVLTELSERRHRTNLPKKSRLAAISLGYKQPKTRLSAGTKKPVRSSLALLSSLAVQIVLIMVFIRLLAHFRSAGDLGLREIFDKVLRTATSVESAARTAADTFEQINLEVHYAADISARRLEDADRVTGEVVKTVEHINRSVDTVFSWPFREALAWSAGLRSASMALFKKRDDSNEGRKR
jgi:hypothetical protein